MGIKVVNQEIKKKNVLVKSDCRVERSWQQRHMGHSVRLHNLLDFWERKKGRGIQGDCEISFYFFVYV